MERTTGLYIEKDTLFKIPTYTTYSKNLHWIMLTWYLTTGMSETSKNSSLSKPKKLSFIYCEMGFPAKLSVLKWCIECQAEDGGVASSLRLRSRSRTLDKLAMVSGATKVKWLDDTFKVFNCGNWKLGKRVKEVLAIFKIWRWVRTPVNNKG